MFFSLTDGKKMYANLKGKREVSFSGRATDWADHREAVSSREPY